ncbi:MAG: hypothetical protein V7K40_24190 [Nostoc sp.]|uniref:hypothetical protein n=1 Tax=Nostoc sp. TaxID=1180 RepID=UPI002FFC3C07
MANIPDRNSFSSVDGSYFDFSDRYFAQSYRSGILVERLILGKVVVSSLFVAVQSTLLQKIKPIMQVAIMLG